MSSHSLRVVAAAAVALLVLVPGRADADGSYVVVKTDGSLGFDTGFGGEFAPSDGFEWIEVTIDDGAPVVVLEASDETELARQELGPMAGCTFGDGCTKVFFRRQELGDVDMLAVETRRHHETESTQAFGRGCGADTREDRVTLYRFDGARWQEVFDQTTRDEYEEGGACTDLIELWWQRPGYEQCSVSAIMADESLREDCPYKLVELREVRVDVDIEVAEDGDGPIRHLLVTDGGRTVRHAWHEERAEFVADGSQIWCPPPNRIAGKVGEEQQCLDESGARDGGYLRWHDADTLAEAALYDDGERVGLYEKWHRNGRPKLWGRYDEDGEAFGEWRVHHANGKVRKKEFFVHGERHGDYVHYDESGTRIEEGVFVAGDKFPDDEAP